MQYILYVGARLIKSLYHIAAGGTIGLKTTISLNIALQSLETLAELCKSRQIFYKIVDFEAIGLMTPIRYSCPI